MSETSPQRMAPGIAAGLVLSVPVALRGVWGWPGVGAALPSPLLAALVLMLGAVSLIVVPVGLWIRRAPLKDPASADRALLLGAALSSLPLALFGGVLKSTTHHRPLGGATFAVGACFVLALCVGLAWRVGGSAVKASWLKQFFSVCSGLSLLVTIAFAAGNARILLDFLVLAAACAGAGLLKIPKLLARIPGAVPGGLWGLLLVSAVFLTRDRDATVMQNLRDRAPISFASLSWLGDGS